MVTRRLASGLVLGLVLGLTSAAPVAATSSGPARQGAGEAVRSWNAIAATTLNGLPGPAGGAPPAAAVHVAMVQTAVFDAVNAIGRKRYRPYLLWERFPAWASEEAAVAAAAHGVLRAIVGTVPHLAEDARSTLLAGLDSQYAEALADVPDGPREAKGVAAGEAAAGAMIAARADDGRFGPSPWVPDPRPGHWSPLTDPATGQPVLDPTPWVGDVEPFTLRSVAQLRTREPLDLTSARYARELEEVRVLGSATSTVRTPFQGYVARWWQSSPVGLWNAVGRELAERRGLDGLATARMLALQNLSGADASIGCWNDKYHWDFWRPWNAIRRADEDGNPATRADPAWAPLFAAPYPDHPSGHLCLDAAHARVLTSYFGDRAGGGFSITSSSALLQPGEVAVRRFERFSQVLAEVVEARIWAGLHFRTADEQGKLLGLRAAGWVTRHALEPLHHRRHHHR